MKKLCALMAALLTFGVLHAQKEVIHSVEIPVEFHGITGKLIDYVEPPGTVNEITKTEKIGYHPKTTGV